MRKEFIKHKLAYIILFIFLSLAIFLFFAVWPDRVFQRYLIALMAMFYFFWGIISHVKTKKISRQVIFEYFGVSLLAGLLLLLVTV